MYIYEKQYILFMYAHLFALNFTLMSFYYAIRNFDFINEVLVFNYTHIYVRVCCKILAGLPPLLRVGLAY